jgi:hypothetical protein
MYKNIHIHSIFQETHSKILFILSQKEFDVAHRNILVLQGKFK